MKVPEIRPEMKDECLWKTARVFSHSGRRDATLAWLRRQKSAAGTCGGTLFPLKSATFLQQKSHRRAAKVPQSRRKCGTFDPQKCHTCNLKFVIYNYSSAKSAGTQRPTEKASRRRFFRPRGIFSARTRFWRWILLLKFSKLGLEALSFQMLSRYVFMSDICPLGGRLTHTKSRRTEKKVHSPPPKGLQKEGECHAACLSASADFFKWTQLP